MKYVYIGTAVLLVVVLAFAIVKKVSPVGWGLWGQTNTSDGLVLRGYDPIAYFDEGKPVEGSSEHRYDWAGGTWQFANAKNRDLFAADPERYAPQFGSFCSFAVSKGFTANSSPEAWHIHEDKLYVFMDENVRDDWVAGLPDGSLNRSESSWAKR